MAKFGMMSLYKCKKWKNCDLNYSENEWNNFSFKAAKNNVKLKSRIVQSNNWDHSRF